MSSNADPALLGQRDELRATPVHAPPKPRLRGRLHLAAFPVSVPAGLALVLIASGTREIVAAAVYAIALSGLFGVSAAYHLGRWGEVAHARMQRLDHSMIFVLIAATYTPYCLLVLEGTLATVVLAAVWAGALVGIATKLYRVDLHVLSGCMYIGLGWLVLVSLPALLRGLDPIETALLVAGGAIYSLGALVLALHRPDPVPHVFGYHEVWHAATIAAAACQYASIVLVVLGGT